jgi:hypothetical protein
VQEGVEALGEGRQVGGSRRDVGVGSEVRSWCMCECVNVYVNVCECVCVSYVCGVGAVCVVVDDGMPQEAVGLAGRGQAQPVDLHKHEAQLRTLTTHT